MPVAAPIAGLAGSAISGIFGNSAANAQADAAKQAAAVQQNALDFSKASSALNRNDQFPWLATGTNAINTLSRLMGINALPAPASVPGADPKTAAYWSMTAPARTAAANPAPSSLNPTNIGANPSPTIGNAASLNPAALSYTPTAAGAVDAYGNPLPQGTSQAAPGYMLPNGQGATNSMRPAGVTDVNSGQQLPAPGYVSPSGAVNNSMSPAGVVTDNPQSAGGFTNMGTAGMAMANVPPGAQGATGTSSPDPLDPTGMLGADGSLAQGWNQKFVAPDNITEQNDPGFQARLKTATDALQNSAAARGNLLTGGTAKDLGNMAQDYASNEYGNVYNRALGQYQQNYNIFQQNQANTFNRLAALSGAGQVTAGNLAGGQMQTAGQVMQGSQAIGQDLNNAAYQRASGYLNTGNAISSGLNNAASLAAILKGTGTASNAGWGVV